MSSSPESWTLFAPRSALPALEPLIAAHRTLRPVEVVERDSSEAPDPSELAEALEDSAGALLVADRRRSPRSVLPGPFLQTKNGRRVPVGWLPLVAPDALGTFAHAAAEVLSRPADNGPLALLGQWDAQVERMVERGLGILRAQGQNPSARVFRWTADRIVRDDLLRALPVGLGAAMYFGHGRPYGWAGYHGLHSKHLVAARGKPIGAILSLTCHTANRRGVGLSFAESIVLGGVAAAALGAVGPTKTIDNWWWGSSLCEELANRPSCLGEWLLRSCPPRENAVVAYRIVGDPLAPLRGDALAVQDGERVWAPAPEDSPTPPGYDAWLASLATT